MERQQKAYKVVIDYFKKKILDGELRPGEKLPPERDIAEQLNVSRNSVREPILCKIGSQDHHTGDINAGAHMQNRRNTNQLAHALEALAAVFLGVRIHQAGLGGSLSGAAGDDDDDVCHESDRLQADQSDTPGIGMSGLFACNRECNRWSDRRNGESSKGTGSESG